MYILVHFRQTRYILVHFHQTNVQQILGAYATSDFVLERTVGWVYLKHLLDVMTSSFWIKV